MHFHISKTRQIPKAPIFLILLLVFQCSCKKYLDKKPVDNLAVISTLNDLEALLSTSNLVASSPAYLEFVADNFYLSNATYNSPANLQYDKVSYIWDKDAIVSLDVWNKPYYTIYVANLVLDNLPKVAYDQSQQGLYNAIKGTALFYRAFMCHGLAQLFCRPYTASAQNDPGIVLRLTADVEAPSVRSTVQQTYDQIITDLNEAVELLPLSRIFTTFPNKASVYGLLARVYLSMSDYENAGKYAGLGLQLNNALLDYNNLTAGSIPDFKDNPEIMFTAWEGYVSYDLLGPAGCKVDTVLYASFNTNDLRKTVFFGSNGTTQYWRGSYRGGTPYIIYDGIATDELYLIRAESKARAGNINEAMQDLNTLLVKRYKTGTFSNLTATDAADALNKVLSERRKELAFRGQRWSDLRRFNLEGANITLKRIINGTIYALPPNDLRWVLLIPAQEIIRGGIAQNPR
jgi:starch-binding outer membrane protein, SusD/RagB family